MTPNAESGEPNVQFININGRAKPEYTLGSENAPAPDPRGFALPFAVRNCTFGLTLSPLFKNSALCTQFLALCNFQCYFCHLEQLCNKGADDDTIETVATCLVITEKMAFEAKEEADTIKTSGSGSVLHDASGVEACLRALNEKIQFVRKLSDQHRSKSQRRKSLKNFTNELHEVNQWLDKIDVLDRDESMGATVQQVRIFIEKIKEKLRAVQRKSQEIEGMLGALKIMGKELPDTEECTTEIHRKVFENVRQILRTLEERMDVATLYGKFLKLSDDVSQEMNNLYKHLTSSTSKSRDTIEKDQMEAQRQNIQQIFLQSCNLSKNCTVMLDEKVNARVDVKAAKKNITDIMDRLNAQQSDLIHAWSAEKTRESQRQSQITELQAKVGSL